MTQTTPTAFQVNLPVDRPLQVGKHEISSRLIVGTGRYETMQQMRESLDRSGATCVTVAVRRERLYNQNGQNILDFIDLDRYTLLPNTAGCYTAKDAVRARLSLDARSCARSATQVRTGSSWKYSATA